MTRPCPSVFLGGFANHKEDADDPTKFSGGKFGAMARVTQMLHNGVFFGLQLSGTMETANESHEGTALVGGISRTTRVEVESNFSADIMGRFGANLGGVSPYIAGGLSILNAEMKLSRRWPSGRTLSDTASDTHTGWKIALGADFNATENIRIFAQAGYTQYGKKSYSFTVDGQTIPGIGYKTIDGIAGILYAF